MIGASTRNSTAFSGSGHEQLWSVTNTSGGSSSLPRGDEPHLDGQTPPYDVEYRLRNRGDAWVWIQERGRVIERDPIRASLAGGWDCVSMWTSGTNTAHALERSESRFAHAVWGTSVGFWDHDIATDTVHWWNDWCASVDLDPCEGANHSRRVGTRAFTQTTSCRSTRDTRH